MEFANIYTKRMGQNPAQVDRGTGDLFINPDVWPYLPESFQTWILLHEEGHLKGGSGAQPTADELLADKYAFEQFVGTEKESLRKSVMILHDSLPGHTDQQWKRIITMYARALEYDYYHNGNKGAFAELQKVKADLKDYVGISNKPFFPSQKSNWITAAIGALVALVQLGVSESSKTNARNYNESVSDVNSLQQQTAVSNQMADEMIFENNTIQGVSYYLIGLLVLVIAVALYFYLKKK